MMNFDDIYNYEQQEIFKGQSIENDIKELEQGTYKSDITD